MSSGRTTAGKEDWILDMWGLHQREVLKFSTVIFFFWREPLSTVSPCIIKIDDKNLLTDPQMKLSQLSGKNNCLILGEVLEMK